MKLNSIFKVLDFSILTGNKTPQHTDSMGNNFEPASGEVIPTFKTVLPNGVTQWVGEQGTEFKAWCKKFNVGTIYSRFDKGRKKLVLEKIEVYS